MMVAGILLQVPISVVASTGSIKKNLTSFADNQKSGDKILSGETW